MLDWVILFWHIYNSHAKKSGGPTETLSEDVEHPKQNIVPKPFLNQIPTHACQSKDQRDGDWVCGLGRGVQVSWDSRSTTELTRRPTTTMFTRRGKSFDPSTCAARYWRCSSTLLWPVNWSSPWSARGAALEPETRQGINTTRVAGAFFLWFL